MSSSLSWCVIFNMNTVSMREYHRWKKFLEDGEILHTSYQTHSVIELKALIEKIISCGHRYFLFAGGDGTLHQGGNVLMQYVDLRQEFTLGVLPCGSGNDWVRTFGLKAKALTLALKNYTYTSHNVLQVQLKGGETHYAFNMLGAAFDASVVDSINHSKVNLTGKLKYMLGILIALGKPHRWPGKLKVDGKEYKGDWLTIQAGFGKYCGGGMYVLPHAGVERAALLLMKQKSIIRLITSLPKIYNGKIAKQPEAIALHFDKLEINHLERPLPIEADGEWLGESPAVIIVVKGINRVN
ncbi:MAG: hypothetical protein M3R25_09465 [Bacteroidota bacterium]|nr:hypothetical protein [Bacteroidota bacterium]